MHISWFGEGCFRIQSGNTDIILDPLDKESGLGAPRFRANIIMRTRVSFSLPFERSEILLIQSPGEYEVDGVEILGKALAKESDEKQINTAYRILIDEMKVVALGYLRRMPDVKDLEEFMNPDALFIPGGGSPFIDQKDAVKLIRQLKPKMVIPTHFKVSGLKRKADDIKVFLKEIEQNPEPQEKLSIKKKDLPSKITVALMKI